MNFWTGVFVGVVATSLCVAGVTGYVVWTLRKIGQRGET